jgi:LPXTG-motif cell wall-anchored protein
VTPTPSGTPNSCGGTCGSNSNCEGGLFCYQGLCRNPSCSQESDCSCKSTSTPPPVLGASTPPQLPKTGSGLEVVAGLAGIAGIGMFIFRRFRLI